jgi:hypothetical protein
MLSEANPELVTGLSLHESIEITQKHLEAREQSPSRTAYVNSLKVSKEKIKLDTSEDALMMTLKLYKLDKDRHVVYDSKGTPKFTQLKFLIDSGASISAIASRCTAAHENEFADYKMTEPPEMAVTFANDEQANTTAAFTGMSLFERVTEKEVIAPVLHELNLPQGIDGLLGMDWLKQYNPSIDWTNGTLQFDTSNSNNTLNPNNLKRARGKRICWMHRAPEGLVSWQQMSEIINSKQRVFTVIITDADKETHNPPSSSHLEIVEETVTEVRHRIALAKAKVKATSMPPPGWTSKSRAGGDASNVLHAKSLTKQKLEEILKSHTAEASLEPTQVMPDIPKGDPRHENGRPKLFLNQPETEYPEINKQLLENKDLHVLELSPEVVQANDIDEKRSSLLQHEIELEEGKKPPNRPYYRMSLPELEELKKQVEAYLKAGMIEPSKSPYGAACLFAPKKNGKLRFCIDFRPLNNITIKNAVQPPAADDCLAQMAGCQIFSMLDLSQGYHQCPIKPEDREKTAFNTKYGHYQWKVLPFGLTNAPATFVNALNRIFSGEAHLADIARRKSKGEKCELDPELAENLLDKFVTVYIDDILCYSRTEAEHAEHLRRIFQRLRFAGLLIQSPKAYYAQKEVDYLGHIVTTEGIQVQQDKITTISEWPTPTETSHVRQFLGLSGFYRKFITKYASKAKPLSDLTKKENSGKDIPFRWPPEAETAFQELKTALTSAPVLAIPDAARAQFHINCDASEFGLGATLFQKGEADGKMHPCAYISRVLKPSEIRAYQKSRCVYELELKALMYALEKWRHWLEGQVGTTVETDHQSLTWLQTQTDLTKTQTGFLDTLARYDLRIKYLKGELNIPADAPSRRPDYKDQASRYMTDIQLDEYEAAKKEIERLTVQLKDLQVTHNKAVPMEENRKRASARRVVAFALSRKHSDIQQFRKDSNLVSSIVVSPSNGSLNEWLRKIVESYAESPTYKERTESEEFVMLENYGFSLWYHRTPEGDDTEGDLPPAVCIPNEAQALKKLILKEFHSPPTIGHYNGLDMFRKMQRSYYWPGMRKECEDFAKHCRTCQPHKPNHTGGQGLLAHPENPIRPWSSVALDFFGPMNTRGKIKVDSILVAVCRLTKMAHFIPCPSTATAEDIADLLVDNVVRLHGLADDYRSDRDKIFTSKFWQRVWGRLGTTLSLSTAYHHQTAGQVERVNTEMKRYLSIYCDSHADWKEHLGLAELAYNSHINASTGCTPFELNYGFQPRNPNELITPKPLQSNEALTAAEKKAMKSGDGWLAALHDMWEKAETTARKTFTKYKKSYDKKHKDTRKFYPVGSLVYLGVKDLQNPTTVGREMKLGQDEHVKRKLLPFYLGPFRVLEVCGKENLNRRLDISKTLKERLDSDIFHIEKLKPAGEVAEPFSVTDIKPPQYNEEFHVEKILAFEQRTNGKRYLVKWEGYPDSENSWEWEWYCEGAQDRIRDFMKTNPVQKNVRRQKKAK